MVLILFIYPMKWHSFFSVKLCHLKVFFIWIFLCQWDKELYLETHSFQLHEVIEKLIETIDEFHCCDTFLSYILSQLAVAKLIMKAVKRNYYPLLIWGSIQDTLRSKKVFTFKDFLCEIISLSDNAQHTYTFNNICWIHKWVSDLAPITKAVY